MPSSAKTGGGYRPLADVFYWDLLIAVVALFAGYSLLGGGGFGRVVAYLWAILVIIESFLIIGIAPWFAAAMIALAVLVIYGLTIAGESSSESS